MNQHIENSWIIVKFGGTSVSNLAMWENIAVILRNHLDHGRRPFMVCSAPSGVSNLLEQLLQAALRGDTNPIINKIIIKYKELSNELKVNVNDYLTQHFSQLQQLLEGIHLLGEITPRVHARVMAYGELLLTQLGVQYLKQCGFKTSWQDARDWLQVENHADFRHPDAYLSARCASHEVPELQKKLQGIDADVIVTQGFIAQNERGETVLLGRGGSDSSATYLAAKLKALGCEIWTDVPGIYTANPRHIPDARLITELNYDEAQELASMGAKVLHPPCIAPVARHHIPLYVKYTQEPNRPGTRIDANQKDSSSQIKSILTKHDIILISIETVHMWHQVGFLAEVFQCFKRHGVSIDLISTSESSVTMSLDKNANAKETRVLDTLLLDLGKFAKVSVISPCASVSLVGRNIRAILPQLGSVFSVFEEQKIYLVSQAANDLNLTFVVDEEQALRLATKLHHLLIEQQPHSSLFHLSWAEEYASEVLSGEKPWWEAKRLSLLEMADQSPCYVYSEAFLRQQVANLKRCDAVNQFYYSIKANNNAKVLHCFYEAGLGFECVSTEELNLILKLFPAIERTRILFTANFAPKEEYQYALQKNVRVTVDNFYIIEQWASMFSQKEIFIRIDLGEGSGHHRYVVTGGDQSKFGIPLSLLPKVSALAKEQNIHIVGLHSHSGSGILNQDHWQAVFTSLVKHLPLFPEARVLNVGGGLGVIERTGQKPLDLVAMNAGLALAKQSFSSLTLWMEPGRYLVAEAGVLLAKVTQVKRKGDLQFVGIETGMNSLIRPMLYGAYHEIVNLTRLEEPKSERVNIVGPICETGDTLGYSRWLPASKEGDVILIATAGAYGRSMSSCYNLRAPALEYFLYD